MNVPKDFVSFYKDFSKRARSLLFLILFFTLKGGSIERLKIYFSENSFEVPRYYR